MPRALRARLALPVGRGPRPGRGAAPAARDPVDGGAVRSGGTRPRHGRAFGAPPAPTRIGPSRGPREFTPRPRSRSPGNGPFPCLQRLFNSCKRVAAETRPVYTLPPPREAKPRFSRHSVRPGRRSRPSVLPGEVARPFRPRSPVPPPSLKQTLAMPDFPGRCRLFPPIPANPRPLPSELARHSYIHRQ